MLIAGRKTNAEHEQARQFYLESVIKTCPTISEEELKFIESDLIVSELNPRDIYIRAGAVQKNLGFIYKGLLRVYYIDSKGNDVTIRFVKEGEFAADCTNFATQAPSEYSIQCIEPTILVNMSHEHIKNGFEKYSGIERYARLFHENILKGLMKRIESFLSDNAEQRYLNFISENPDLYNRVSLSYLSTYLGIERPSLSRIRRKISGR